VASTAATRTLHAPAPVRKKSGLVRTAGLTDTVIFALCGISVGIMVEWGQFFGEGFYPGGNTYVALAISLIGGLIVASAYGYWGRVFPRSGADYVFLTRGLGPGLGFGLNFAFIWVLAITPAVSLSIVEPCAASSASAVGNAVGWHWLEVSVPNFLNGDWGYFLLGVSLIGFSVLISLFGLRPMLRYLMVLVGVGTIGGLITIIALAFSSQGTFVRHLEPYVGHSVPQIMAHAKQAGFAHGGFDLGNTFKVTVWYAISLYFAGALLLYIGGEIKDAATNAVRGIKIAVAFSVGVALIWTLALDHVIPRALQGALAFNSTAAPAYSTANVAYPHELLRVLWGTSFPAILLVISGFLAFGFWSVVWTPQIAAFFQRAMLAWSLDGVAPAWLGKVSEKRHTPTNAALVTFLLVSAFFAVYAFDHAFRTVVFIIPSMILMTIVMTVGAVFPYRRKELFQQSIVANLKIGPVPAMTVVCGAGALVMGFWSWRLFSDPIGAGTDRRPLWVAAAGVVAVAAYYLALRQHRRRQGVDMDQTFKEIPVE
jgi:amino acid transporter